MPRILKLREVDGQVWANLEMDFGDTQPVYVWTADEVKRDRASTIRTFMFDLANDYIENKYPEKLEKIQ